MRRTSCIQGTPGAAIGLTRATLLLNGRIRHGLNPVLTMCAANAVVTKDPAGSRKLDKGKATGRIDGLQALAMAVGVAGTTPAPVEAPETLVMMI